LNSESRHAVHVYTYGDEAELFLNGKSLGKKKKEKFQYRIRWDDVVYEPGEVRVVVYKEGKRWATDSIKTNRARHAVAAQARSRRHRRRRP
jgi:beta-galactosidase